jgi:predicted transcriptional regulator
MAATTKVGLNMPTSLYKKLAKLAEENGQTTTRVLEEAAEHYIHYVRPTQNSVRPEFMAHVRRSMTKNDKLLRLLAK